MPVTGAFSRPEIGRHAHLALTNSAARFQRFDRSAPGQNAPGQKLATESTARSDRKGTEYRCLFVDSAVDGDLYRQIPGRILILG
jgi:hypothetical protein